MQPARDWYGVDAAMFAETIVPLNRPAVLRNLVAHWPAVSKARQSAQSLAD